MTLKELYHSKGYDYYCTDKDRNHNYLQTYSELFGKWQHEPINILEVGCYRNGSLKLFEEFFVNAKIIGVDIQTYEGAVELNRATVIIGDFYSSQLELPPLHIAIDDGPHDVNSQMEFVRKVWPYMVPGGILVVEDIMPGFKPHFDQLGIPYTAIAFYPPTDQEDDRLLVFRK